MRNILYRQSRIGQGGKPFDLYKIRTMKGEILEKDVNSHQVRLGGDYVFSDFYRTTVISVVLRYLGLDEIPQIYNLIKGEMQLIGIRPKQPEQFELLPDDIKDYYLKHKPGLFPGDLAFGNANGDLQKKIENIRAFIGEASKYEKFYGQKEYLKSIEMILSLIIKVYLKRLRDPVHIDSIRLRFNMRLARILELNI